MDSFDRLNHLTQPAVKNLPKLEQPVAVHTRYAVKSDGDASISAFDATVQTNIWFKSPVGFLACTLITGINVTDFP
ncbi:hypothetical protein CDV31_016274 [Fusarium ambrosium]|uniref:Uncharacterized protein n=1 Tax=Fusarium ambrosium TaxID=131363 RepID=A0A428SBV8_9HYPO|nr:hypothetical protein CDV31_016274 [Fusarium ambrosium]